MKKIILAIDGISLDKNALHFACYLGRLHDTKVTGIFLENLPENEKFVIKPLLSTAYVDSVLDETSPEYLSKMETINKNIELFKETCIREGVNFIVHKDKGVPAVELIEETRFADMLIIDAETSFKKSYEGALTSFVKDILKNAECPVIIAPEAFDGIDEIVFCYDGSASSAFAIKQFTYLFGELNNKQATVIHVNEHSKEMHSIKYHFKEWLKMHYSNIVFEELKGDVEDELFYYLYKKTKSIVVMGAYGRSSISRLFKKSAADLVIKTVTQPIFITHQ